MSEKQSLCATLVLQTSLRTDVTNRPDKQQVR